MISDRHVPLDTPFRIANRFHVEPSLNMVSGPRGSVHLEPKVMQVLVCLAQYAGEVVQKERLMQAVWHETFVSDDVLTRAISELRRIFEDDPKRPEFIETITKRGYRLIATREYSRSSNQTVVTTPRSSARVRDWRAWLWIVTGAVILAVSAGLLQWRAQRSRTQARQMVPIREQPLTALRGREVWPAISPDGKQIAFSWNGARGGEYRIYVRLIGAGEPLRLTSGPGMDRCPAWSPDGRYLAFARYTDADKTISIVPALGGAVRSVHVTTATVGIDSFGLTWSPDGRLLAFPDRQSAGEPYAIWLLALDDLRVWRLTSPPANVRGDRNPVFSPDGRFVAFDRTREEPQSSDLFVVPTSGGEARRLSVEGAHGMGPAWMPDSRQIIWSRREQQPGFWRLTLDSPGLQQWLFAGESASPVSISHDGRSMVFAKPLFDADIWQLPIESPVGPAHAASPLIESSWPESAPQFSPDGRRIAYESDESGRPELWVSDADGSNPLKLTAFDGPNVGSPRWSPDGQQIVFGVDESAGAIYVIGAMGGTPRRVVGDAFTNVVPSWSRDGLSIYFASNRSGTKQVWNVRLADGVPHQVTTHGGFATFESSDGRVLYYSKWDEPGIWSMPVGGGAERLVLNRPEASMWGYWALVDRGIFFVENDEPQHPMIKFLRFGTNDVVNLARMQFHAFLWNPGLAVSPDGKRLLYSQVDQEGCDLMLVDRADEYLGSNTGR